MSLYNGDFQKYLIMVGVRSYEFTYDVEKDIFNHIDYFKKCFDDGLSAYKALVFFHDYLEELKNEM